MEHMGLTRHQAGLRWEDNHTRRPFFSEDRFKRGTYRIQAAGHLRNENER